MYQIESNNFEKIRLLILNNGKTYFPLIGAVLYQYQKGKVFIDDFYNTIFIITGFGFAQYFQLNSHSANEELVTFISSSDQLPCYFHIYDSSQSFAGSLEKQGCNIKLRERYQLRYLDKNPLEIICPNDFQLMKCESVEFEKFDPFNLNFGNKFWPSSVDFIQKSNGICLLNQDKHPASICYAACNVDGISEIDISTLPAYKNQGLGATVTKAFVNNSLDKNLKPNWDCFSENTASLRIAKRIGFDEIKNYLLLSVYNKRNEQKRS